jgi:hypothetical protein
MTDEELEKLLERREARLRDELESQERDREYKRREKSYQLQNRIMTGVGVGALWLLLTVIISTCAAEKAADLQTQLLEQRMRALEQKK